MKKTNTKSNTSKAKEAKPILSTGKKIGLTIYFTFVFTLMGIMGLQIWLNGPNGLLSNENTYTPPKVATQEVVTQNQDDVHTDTDTYSTSQANNTTQTSDSPTIDNTNYLSNTTGYSY